MKAMILAAGRGERLRPLTDTIPKPLLQVGDHCLIEWHIKRLHSAGLTDIVVNVSYLGDLIQARLGDGSQYGVRITYSQEPPGALETGGGICKALPLLGEPAFIVVNADIWSDFPFEQLSEPKGLAHLVMVNNPAQHPDGDFVLDDDHVLDEPAGARYTFSGIGVYRPELFSGKAQGRFPLAPVLKLAMKEKAVSGELYQGNWYDIGTIDRLERLQNLIQDMRSE